MYTSIHIAEYEAEARDTKLGPEEITRDVPGVGDDALKNLDERGIIRVGRRSACRRYSCRQGYAERRDRTDCRGKIAACDFRRKSP